MAERERSSGGRGRPPDSIRPPGKGLVVISPVSADSIGELQDAVSLPEIPEDWETHPFVVISPETPALGRS
jgi:hypothetical protein